MSQNTTAAEAEVIKYLRRKSNNGDFDAISWIGAEQRFVNSLRNSGVDNLEEQYIVGTNTYTVEYIDSKGNEIIEKSFCTLKEGQTPEDIGGYYKLITTIFDKKNLQLRYYFNSENEAFVIPDKPEEIEIDKQSETLKCKDKNIFEFTPVPGKEDVFTLSVTDNDFYTVQKEELYFVKTNKEQYKILTKEIKIKNVVETIENMVSVNKKITKEVITYADNFK